MSSSSSSHPIMTSLISHAHISPDISVIIAALTNHQVMAPHVPASQPTTIIVCQHQSSIMTANNQARKGCVGGGERAGDTWAAYPPVSQRQQLVSRNTCPKGKPHNTLIITAHKHTTLLLAASICIQPMVRPLFNVQRSTKTIPAPHRKTSLSLSLSNPTPAVRQAREPSASHCTTPPKTAYPPAGQGVWTCSSRGLTRFSSVWQVL